MARLHSKLILTQIFTGHLPFALIREEVVSYQVTKGTRPSRPVNSLKVGLTDSIWGMMVDCWQKDYKNRPPAQSILDALPAPVDAGDDIRDL
jgi:hypothetical protein